MRGPILYDLSEFLGSLLRSGVQRVVFQVARHWPIPGQLVPIRVDDDGRLLVLPARVFDLMAVYFGARPGKPESAREELWRLAHLGRTLRQSEMERYQGLLNVEVFFHNLRVEFYERLLRTWGREKIFFFVHDLLLWLHPEWFSQTDFPGTLGYLRLLRQAGQLAFNSQQTRDDYLHRFLRQERAVGPAVPLGADGLGLARPAFAPESRRFAVLGTIEPRKNHFAVLDAFEQLWAEGVEAELIFVGRLGWVGPEGKDRLERASQQPRFRWVSSASDEEIVSLVRQCRATVYPSLGEGFGLPPLESLALGVPVIVSAALPGIQMIEPSGQVRLAAPEPESIRQAVLALLDDTTARRLHDEIEQLRLPTWEGMARHLAGWVNATPSPPLPFPQGEWGDGNSGCQVRVPCQVFCSGR
jgi:glycosyltransferase involved in cell wall biosynthesis